MLVWISGIKLRRFLNVVFQRVGYTYKKDEIEDPMIRRIQSVFQRATIKWKVSAQCVLNCERCEDVCVCYDLDAQMWGCGFLSWLS